MRTPRRLALALATVVGSIALVAPATSAGAAPGDLYVAQGACAPGGTGTIPAPFCTINAALAIVQPGQTVLVHTGQYLEKIELDVSGTESAPITIRAVNSSARSVLIGGNSGQLVDGTAISLIDVHDVVIEGFRAVSPSAFPPVLIQDSERVTIDGLSVVYPSPNPLRVTGESTDVTISRGWFSHPNGAAGVSIGPGVTDTVITGNTFRSAALTVADASGTAIVGNTVVSFCRPGIVVNGTVPDLTVKNNIVRTGGGNVEAPTACADPATATAITVPAGTTADYNLIDPSGGGALYRWGTTDYTDLAAFRTATGQGAHDIAAAAELRPVRNGGVRGYIPLGPTSPAVDSADATAAGALATDLFYNSHADAPTIANSGTGNGYHDRGAVELQGPTSGGDQLDREPGGHPFDVAYSASFSTAWTTDGPVGRLARQFSDEKVPTVGRAGPADHRFRRAGVACVVSDTTEDDFRSDTVVQGTQKCVLLGARYAVMTPTRVLDTRYAVGVSTTVPIAANGEAVLPLGAVGGVPAADVSAVVLNVTVTRPTAVGALTVYPDGSSTPLASNLNYVAGETVANLVTVPVINGNLRFRNGGTGTVHVIADLLGSYAGGGHKYSPLNPVRVLDSRSGAPFAANSGRVLDLSARVPTTATAVVLNMTAVQPTAGGLLKVGTTTTSNLNFAAGQTIPNLVVAPVVNGRVTIQHDGLGTVHVLADLAGWFGPTGTDEFVPNGPARILDTRTTNDPVHSYDPRTVTTKWLVPNPGWGPPSPTALVANVTVTRSVGPGLLTLWPSDSPRPLVSNLNFQTGETAANAVMVRTSGVGHAEVGNDSVGSVHVIVDQAGYFIRGA